MTSDLNWCFDSWRQFTTLAPEEEMLMKMAKIGTLTEFTLSKIREELNIAKEKGYRLIALPRKARRVRVLETGQIFNSIKECANFFGVSNKTVYSAFEKGCKLRGHKIERIY
jgi:hypothetical protein